MESVKLGEIVVVPQGNILFSNFLSFNLKQTKNPPFRMYSKKTTNMTRRNV